MADPFADRASGMDSPPRNAFTVTPHATNPVTTVTRGLFIGTGGDLVARMVGDSADVTFKNLANGTVLPGCFAYVRANSTAADILGLY